MVAPNEFWLCVHKLAEAYRSEGLSYDERAANILAQFRDMPAVAQREVLRDLLQIVTSCPDLHPLACAVANDNDSIAPGLRAG